MTSVLLPSKANLELPKVKGPVIWPRFRVGKANRQRKEVPDSGVFASSEQLLSEADSVCGLRLPSEQLPSEADSVCGLRQDDLAVIRSEEL